MARVDSTEKATGINDQPFTKVTKFLTMAGGDGDNSYAKGSSIQQLINDKVYVLLESCLLRLKLPATDMGSFTIADLGCSSGPNTIKIVSDVVRTVTEVYKVRGRDGPEFTAYFNDLPSTDFNFLFHLLESESRDFYYAGVPGSFYGRLFPRSSTNLFLSANSLHWISQIPPAITDKNSAAYNKGRIWVHSTNVDVIKAYKQQAFDDMRRFLDARAEELVPGGLLFCTFGSSGEETGDWLETWLRPTSEDELSTPVSLMRVFEIVWEELISEGILSEEQRAVCNFPWYKYSKEELEEILRSYDATFHIELLDQTIISPASDIGGTGSEESFTERARRAIAPVFEPFFSTILGKDLTLTLIRRVAEVSSERRKNGCLGQYVSHVMALTRK